MDKVQRIDQRFRHFGIAAQDLRRNRPHRPGMVLVAQQIADRPATRPGTSRV